MLSARAQLGNEDQGQAGQDQESQQGVESDLLRVRDESSSFINRSSDRWVKGQDKNIALLCYIVNPFNYKFTLI